MATRYLCGFSDFPIAERRIVANACLQSEKKGCDAVRERMEVA